MDASNRVLAKRKRLAILLAGVTLTLLVAACSPNDRAGPRRTSASITGPNFTEFQSDCPDCHALSPVQRQKVFSAIIQIQVDCPLIGNALMDLYTRGKIFGSTDLAHWGTTWNFLSPLDSTAEVSFSDHMFLITVSDTLYHTARHEGEHYRRGYPSEGSALLAENNCPTS